MTTRRDLFRLGAGAVAMAAVPETIYGTTIGGHLYGLGLVEGPAPGVAMADAARALSAADYYAWSFEDPAKALMATFERNEFRALTGEEPSE